MQGKNLHDFLFQLYDYADWLADQIKPGFYDNDNYFLSLFFIEKMMDRYGRGLINQSAHEANDINLNPKTSLSEANMRLELLRTKMRSLAQEYDFNEVLKIASTQISEKKLLFDEAQKIIKKSLSEKPLKC